MQCTYPRTVGRKADGRSLAWSNKDHSKEYATCLVACGKCLDCRLAYGREWAVRCVHEASMHLQNSFLTLTYDDLKTRRLVYRDAQLLVKRIRRRTDYPLSVAVTGEYGDKEKRPHWHILVFGWEPAHKTFWRKNENGDRIYRSPELEELWPHGFSEFGDITYQSAGYCMRYAAKKLIHGWDDEHDFQPISKKSNKNAIGKRWIEKYWRDVFSHGRLRLEGGVTASIPRYYLKWFEKHNPEEWRRYVTETKVGHELEAAARAAEEARSYAETNYERSCRTARDGVFRGHVTSRAFAQRALTKAKFEILQKALKL